MREILFLAHRIPWPADRGDKIRSHHILRHLAKIAPIHVATFADDARDMGFAAEMDGIVASRHVELRDKSQIRAGVEALLTGQPVSVRSFASPSMKQWICRTLAERNITDIFVFSGQMAQYVPADFAGRFVMDFVDVDSAKFESYAGEGNAAMRWINAREGRMLAAFEEQVARRADVSLFVSEAEAALFRSRCGLGADKILALGNGIDTDHYDPAIKVRPLPQAFPGPLVIFTGQMDYRPNVEAVVDFARNAWPTVLATHPKATFAIVGRNPAPAVQALGGSEGLLVTGAVDDVRSWLKAADVVVAPLRIARGIQNKVLEAMAMAKPVVASLAAAEGISADDGIHFHVEADVSGEAGRVNDLLADPEARNRIGGAARRHVLHHYGWAGQLKPLDAIMGVDANKQVAS